MISLSDAAIILQMYVLAFIATMVCPIIGYIGLRKRKWDYLFYALSTGYLASLIFQTIDLMV